MDAIHCASDLAKTLIAARVKVGLSQRKLDDLSGVTNGCIAKIESGSCESPGIATVFRLLRALGLKLYISSDATADEVRPSETPRQGNLGKQEGGSHYKDMAIQPIEFIHANHLEYAEGAVIKYVCRHRHKGGAQDLRKAIHFLQLLIDLQYPGQRNPSRDPVPQPPSPPACHQSQEEGPPDVPPPTRETDPPVTRLPQPT